MFTLVLIFFYCIRPYSKNNTKLEASRYACGSVVPKPDRNWHGHKVADDLGSFDDF